MFPGFSVQDALLSNTWALPNGAATTYSPSIDLGLNASGLASKPAALVADEELLITAPALTTAEMPDTYTMTYFVQTSPDNATWTTIYASVLVQTGAGGVGAAGKAAQVRLPSNCPRYTRVGATNGGAGNCSTANGQMQLVF